MPFDFNESEYSASDDSVESLVADTLSKAPTQQEQMDLDPDVLEDVDLRLETADYYRAILSNEFFEVNSKAATVVDREIRSFVKGRLEVLLGIRDSAPVSDQFTSEEVQALKLLAAKSEALALLAAKVEAKPGLVQPKKPQQIQSTSRIPPRPRPQAKKIPVPASAPTIKPPSKVEEVSRVAKRPVIKGNSAPGPVVVDRTIEGGETQTFIGHNGEKVTLTEGDVIEENGQKFVVARNEHGTLYRRNITGQVAPAHRLPPMTVQQMNMLQIQQHESNLDRLDTLTGAAILGSLRPQ